MERIFDRQPTINLVVRERCPFVLFVDERNDSPGLVINILCLITFGIDGHRRTLIIVVLKCRDVSIGVDDAVLQTG